MKLTKNIELDVSIINTYLRDKYQSLTDFCEYEDIDNDELIAYLNNNNFYYDSNINKILSK